MYFYSGNIGSVNFKCGIMIYVLFLINFGNYDYSIIDTNNTFEPIQILFL
jgi:hypothetical protein